MGGELKEETISVVNRVLRRAGYEDPFDMSLKERQSALLKLPPESFGIYDAEVQDFLRYMDEMEKVRSLGGLHVIGSERHEARRIDNQLRGRAARQGDPGSSRFYLSMEDELLRLFGGEQADALMQRFKMDEALPLEMNLVSRLIEQSQTRVEGANFDMRKHLLEYDDVLNTQRASIYAQRDRIFTKEDLSEDVTEMLQTEVLRRVPEALKEDEGPWRLLSWLEQIQPPIQINSHIYPSYTLKLIAEDIWSKSAIHQDGRESMSTQVAPQALIEAARSALEAEDFHIIKAVKNVIEENRQRYERQLEERWEAYENFMNDLDDLGEEDNRSPRQLVEDLSNAMRMPIKISNEYALLLKKEPHQVDNIVQDMLHNYLWNQSITRLMGAITRRVEDEVEFRNRLADIPYDWD
ncbi:MAG: hypothetical protein ACPL6F_04200, partial [Anaerolineales bacterium]